MFSDGRCPRLKVMVVITWKILALLITSCSLLNSSSFLLRSVPNPGCVVILLSSSESPEGQEHTSPHPLDLPLPRQYTHLLEYIQMFPSSHCRCPKTAQLCCTLKTLRKPAEMPWIQNWSVCNEPRTLHMGKAHPVEHLLLIQPLIPYRISFEPFSEKAHSYQHWLLISI